MTFLRVIVSLATAALLVLFLNNLMEAVRPFPLINYADAYQECQPPAPDGKGDSVALKQYRDCQNRVGQAQAEKSLAISQYALMRATAVLLVLIAVAVWLYRRYPSYSGALVLGGVIFLLLYPEMSQQGSPFSMPIMYGSAGSISDSVRQRAAGLNALMGLIGFAMLSLADILYFSKYVEKPAKSE